MIRTIHIFTHAILVAVLGLPVLGTGAGIDLPKFEATVADVQASGIQSIADADRLLAQITSLDDSKLSFATLYGKLDDIENTILSTQNRHDLLSNVHPNSDVQSAAAASVSALKEWRVKLFTNEALYAKVKKYQESDDQRLKGQRRSLDDLDQRLIGRVDRDFRRNGFHLSAVNRSEVASLLKELSGLMSDHGKAFGQECWVVFTQDELSGVPADLRARFAFLDGMYHVRATFAELSTIYRNSPRDATRKKALTARYSRAFKQNAERSVQIIRLRDKLAKLLENNNWAEYQTEVTMMKTPDAALNFLSEVNDGVDPLFRDDLATLSKLKATDLGLRDARVQSWDVDYYVNQRLKNEFDVDLSELRQFFEYNNTIKGLFAVVERVFDLKIEDHPLTDKWSPDVTAIRVTDGSTGQLLGVVYLDMFPRENKVDSFSSWAVRPARTGNASGDQMPVAVLLGNISKPTTGPALLELREVQSLLHELGHTLHEILGQTKYATFSGIKVEPDFAEAPAAMLEEFVVDKEVLKLVAKDQSGGSKPFPIEIIERFRQSRALSERITGKRVIALAQMDMDIHTSSP
jgi:Zn-dependent oligopeptidase